MTSPAPLFDNPKHPSADAGKMVLQPTREVTRSVLRYFGGKWALAP
jgi:hypothetical protein